MKHLLVVTPNFLPCTAADMHRARLLAPFAAERGWRIHYLCIDPADNDAPQDDALMRAFPPNACIHRVKAPKRAWQRWLRLNGLSWRVVSPLRHEGARLLQQIRFDLVYFTSTAFDTFRLGTEWKRKFGVPFVVDYQDPWVNDHYRLSGHSPPGGWIKHSVEQFLARRREPECVGNAIGISSVSAGYLEQLSARYDRVPASIVLPFPVDDEPPPEGITLMPGVWTSVGRGGDDLKAAARTLFSTLVVVRAENPEMALPRMIRFVGTSYAPKDLAKPSFLNVAAECGWESISETTDRIPFLDAQKLQQESERLIVLLSSDSAYQPSKLAGVIRSGKPLVIVADAQHRVHQDWSAMRGVTLLKTSGEPADLARRLIDRNGAEAPDWPAETLRQFSASHHADQLFSFFDRIIARQA